MHSYIKYTTIAWTSTDKTKLKKLLGKQKQAARPLLKILNVLYIYKLIFATYSSNKYAASNSANAQDKNKLNSSDLLTSVSKNKS